MRALPEGAAPLAVVLLAFTLRLINLDAQSLWYDEAYTLLLTSTDLTDIPVRAARDTQQPLYFWLLHLWGTGPPVDFYPRLFSALAGTLCVALVYAVARTLVGPLPALYGALFAAVSPFHVFYSQEVRMYAILGVWDLLAVWGFLLGTQPKTGGAGFHPAQTGWKPVLPSSAGLLSSECRRRVGWVLYAGATTLALYTHALGALPSVALLLWGAGLVARRLVPRQTLVTPLVALAVAATLFFPWALVLVRQVPMVFSTFWAAPPNLLSPFASLYLFVYGPFAGPGLFPIALAATLLALAMATVGARHASPLRPSRSTSAPEAATLLWVWTSVPLLTLLALSLVRSVYLERVVIGAAFPVYILLGWGLTRRAAAPFALLTLACAFWGLRNWYTDPAFAKPSERDAAALVQAQWQPGEPVLHTSDGSYLPFLLYAPGLPNRLLAGDPEAAAGASRARSTYEALSVKPFTPEEAIGDSHRFHLVIALDHSPEFQLALAQELDTRYVRAREEMAGGISVRVYVRHD